MAHNIMCSAYGVTSVLSHQMTPRTHIMIEFPGNNAEKCCASLFALRQGHGPCIVLHFCWWGLFIGGEGKAALFLLFVVVAHYTI